VGATANRPGAGPTSSVLPGCRSLLPAHER
jgi:hypothetical protein